MVNPPDHPIPRLLGPPASPLLASSLLASLPPVLPRPLRALTRSLASSVPRLASSRLLSTRLLAASAPWTAQGAHSIPSFLSFRFSSPSCLRVLALLKPLRLFFPQVSSTFDLPRSSEAIWAVPGRSREIGPMCFLGDLEHQSLSMLSCIFWRPEFAKARGQSQ